MLDKEEGEYPSGSCGVRTWGATVTLNTPNASSGPRAPAACLDPVWWQQVPGSPPHTHTPPPTPCFFLSEGARIVPALRGVNLGCASRSGAARRGGVWWIWIRRVRSSSAGTRTLRRVRGRRGARVWLPFRCSFECFPPLFSSAPAKLARQPLTSPRDGR